MGYVKKIINIAIKSDLINHNSFGNYKIQFEKVDRGYLTEQELNLLFKKKFLIKRLEQVRDIFINGYS